MNTKKQKKKRNRNTGKKKKRKRTLVEDTAIAFDETDEAFVVVEAGFPYQRTVPENPHRHFLSFSLPFLSYQTQGKERQRREGEGGDINKSAFGLSIVLGLGEEPGSQFFSFFKGGRVLRF